MYSKELKGAISAMAALQGHLLVASGPKIILHKWNGTELNGVAFFDVPPLHVVSLNIVSDLSLSIYHYECMIKSTVEQCKQCLIIFINL